MELNPYAVADAPVQSMATGEGRKPSPKIKLFLLKQIGLDGHRETMSEEDLARLIPESKVKDIERQARVDHPKVWNRIVGYCTPIYLKEFLDENIKIIQKDEKTPQLSEPWVTFCKDILFPDVSDGRSIKSRAEAPLAHEEDDAVNDDTGSVAPQNLVNDVLRKGLEWFRNKVINSEKIRSTPQASIYRYFNQHYLMKVADKIYPPVKRGIGQRGRGKNPPGRRASDDMYSGSSHRSGDPLGYSGIVTDQVNELIDGGDGADGTAIQPYGHASNGSSSSSSSSTLNNAGVVRQAAPVEGTHGVKRKAGRKKGDDMSETSRDPKEVDKSLNLMVNNYLIGTERVLGKKDLHQVVTNKLAEEDYHDTPDFVNDYAGDASEAQHESLKRSIMEQKATLVRTMQEYADLLDEDHERSACMFLMGMAPTAHMRWISKVINNPTSGKAPSPAATEMLNTMSDVIETAALVPSRLRQKETIMSAKRQKLTHKRRPATTT